MSYSSLIKCGLSLWVKSLRTFAIPVLYNLAADKEEGMLRCLNYLCKVCGFTTDPDDGDTSLYLQYNVYLIYYTHSPTAIPQKCPIAHSSSVAYHYCEFKS